MTKHGNSTATKKFIPAVEGMEARWCPSAASVLVNNGTLIVHTVHANDTISITDDGQGDVSVTVSGGESATGQGSHIKHITVIADGSGDTINYQLTGGLQSNENLDVHLHNGNDTVSFDFSKGVSANHLGVHVDSHRGHDAVTAVFGAINNTSLNFLADFHRGNDSLTLNLNGNVTGAANANFVARGFRGNDVFQVNAANVNVETPANLQLNFQGFRGDDQLITTYSGVVDGNLSIRDRGFRGNDTITTNITADAGSTGNVFARVRGEHGNDSLTLNVNDNSGGTGASTLTKLDAVLIGLTGTDTINHTSNVHVVS